MKYNMVQPGFEPVLSGAVNGKTAFAAMVRAIDHEPPKPTALYLDFGDVAVATASYLRESVFALKAYLRNVGSSYYPVAANANDSVYDELLTIASARNDAIISCSLSSQGTVSDISLIGHLDPKQQLTLELVNQLKDADAVSLMEKYGEEEQLTSTTAWNNRLAGLAARGLIREFKRGRAKYYRPVLEVTE
ncbi:hypothetical protein [Parvibaculum sp.]|uniref:hypothetical protein n=1 Tax=Parvibaculum sp. TaxID=2024848 RepID=UPI0039195586